jgi:hypothetical protein
MHAPLKPSDKSNSSLSAPILTSQDEQSMSETETSASSRRAYGAGTPTSSESSVHLLSNSSNQQERLAHTVMRQMQQTIGNRATMQLVTSLMHRQEKPIQRSLQPIQPIQPVQLSGPRPVIQRQVTAQIIADKSNQSRIGRVAIAGRPERVFGSTMGDHSTAFSVHVEAVRVRVEGYTVQDAIKNFYGLVKSVEHLPGMQVVKHLPPAHAEKFLAAAAELFRLADLINKAGEKNDADAAMLFLQELISAYLSFRELIPLSVINVKAKGAHLAGKGKGEPGKASSLTNHQRGNFQNAKTLYESILALFDASAVALAVSEQSPELTAKMAPGLPRTNPNILMRAYVMQHIQSIQASFPLVFDPERGIDPNAMADSLLREVYNEAKGWLEWQQELNNRKIKSKIDRKNLLKPEMDLLRAEHAKKKKLPKSLITKQVEVQQLDNQIGLLKGNTEWAQSLAVQNEKRLGSLDDYDFSDNSMDTRADEEHELDLSNEEDEEQLDEADKEREDEAEDEEERKQSIATQIIMNASGKIQDIRSSGRTESPFSGTMGAHTTAWVVHVDRIRHALMNQTIPQAFETMINELVPEAVKRWEVMSKAFPAVRKNLQDLYNNLIKPRRTFGSPAEGALYLQQYINNLLTFINFTPGSTLDSADTGGKAEGRRRQLLLLHESGKPQPKPRLLWAILGLIDVKAADPSNHRLLLKHHLDLIRSTYPLSFANSGVQAMKWPKQADLSTSLKKHTGKKVGGSTKKTSIESDITSGTATQTDKAFKLNQNLEFELFGTNDQVEDDDTQEALPLVDAGGGILPDAQQTFIDAYRHDVTHSTAFMTEAEGDVVARNLGFSVQVYRNLPPGFTRVENPGSGHCLIHALQQIYHTLSTGRVPTGATADEIMLARTHIAQNLADEYIIALSGAAVMARITGGMEPGLGPLMRDLLNDRSIINVAIQRMIASEESSEGSKKPEETKSDSKKADASSSGINAQGGGASAVAPLVSLGNGTQLNNNPRLLRIGINSLALFHTGGNHYEMIYRRS